jgi:uncharacterized membrane protein YkoI
MERRTKLITAAAVALAVVAGTGAAAVARDDDGSDKPITGDALDKASAAALAHTHGGRVTETEDGDEEGRYEVEVTLDDGTQVDVHLDADFHVVGQKTDHEERGGDSGDDP